MLVPGSAETLAAAGREAATRSADASCDNWTDKALEFVKAYPFAEFMTDEVRLWAYDAGLPRAPDPRAWGGVMVRAVRQGIVRRKEYRPTKSPTAHGTLGSLWTKNAGTAAEGLGVMAIEAERAREACQIVQALHAWRMSAPECFKPQGAMAAILQRAAAFCGRTDVVIDSVGVRAYRAGDLVFDSALPLSIPRDRIQTGVIESNNWPAGGTLSAVAEHVRARVQSRQLAQSYAAFMLKELFAGADLAELDRLLPGYGLLTVGPG